MTPEQALAFYRAQYEKADGEATRLAMKVGALESQMRGQTFVTPDEKDARIKELEAALQKCRGALADIAASADMTLKLARAKAERIYGETSAETPAPEFDAAWVCGVCGKRHGRGECLGADK